MSINFGGYRFSEPIKLVKWKPLPSSGVYALLVADSLGTSYQVIYFGESESLAALSVDEHHPGLSVLASPGRFQGQSLRLCVSYLQLDKGKKTSPGQKARIPLQTLLQLRGEVTRGAPSQHNHKRTG